MNRLSVAVLAVFCATSAVGQTAVAARGGVVRWLDKVSGETGDLELSRGQSAQNGRLTIQLDECRYPSDEGPSEAYAHLTILDRLMEEPAFSGWMIATSPALSAMDHSRYDVWILRCITD
ncbi:DUF2155 domain-containing protein (plasmid) [Pseudorhodobacter turbinis]|uniref:DUF2155 domain-containing protein n=1 Tax=Pseudorhodobacter turbinis TaxID=2500533 RepID=A0A4P8EI19_9RHOB|nr:DUF2155 domain-containing protein [Pseudorhodobacter turbinis]QCO56800.1 DUF2155 domain-containing protein [Pseudorhodobacter turbinis]